MDILRSNTASSLSKNARACPGQGGNRQPLTRGGENHVDGRASFIPADPIGEEAAGWLSWRFVPLVTGDEIRPEVESFDPSIEALKERHEAWIKYDDGEGELVIALYDRDHPTLPRCFASTLRLVARGDVDGDGLEDIIVLWGGGNVDWERLGQRGVEACGTLSRAESVVLTRRSPTSRYERLCPRANDPDQAGVTTFWESVNGRCATQ